MGLAPTATAAERNEAVAALSPALNAERAQVSGWVAIAAGAIVESGADLIPLANRLMACLPAVVRRATEFGEFILPLALSSEASADIDDDSDGEWLGDQYLPASMLSQASSEHPAGADAWDAISHWAVAATACFTRDVTFRRRAVAELPGVERLAQLNGDAKCLSILIAVPDNEPFVVIHPSSRLGYRLRVSGVADNFQLHTLLSDLLVRPPAPRFMAWLRGATPGVPGERPDPTVAAIARGEGPQHSDVPSQGVWDLYDWHALQADGTLPPKVSLEHYIWGEGIPAHIPRFDGQRVVLLAPPSYGRGWNTSRYFSALRADVVVEEVLTESAVLQLLALMGRANVSP